MGQAEIRSGMDQPCIYNEALIFAERCNSRSLLISPLGRKEDRLEKYKEPWPISRQKGQADKSGACRTGTGERAHGSRAQGEPPCLPDADL